MDRFSRTLFDWLLSFSSNRHKVDLSGSIATGLCVATVFWTADAMSKDVGIHDFALYLIAFLFHKTLGAWKRSVPSWLLISALGSMVFVLTFTFVPNVLRTWLSEPRHSLSLFEVAIQESSHIKDYRNGFLFLFLISFPVMGLTHAVGYLANRIRGLDNPVKLIQ